MTQFQQMPDPRRRVNEQPGREVQDQLRWRPVYPMPDPPQPCEQSPSRTGARVVALCLLVLALVVGFFALPHIDAFLSTIGKLGPNVDRADKAIGLAAFGIILVSILAAMKIALNSCQRGE